jgi:hypothetical protein
MNEQEKNFQVPGEIQKENSSICSDVSQILIDKVKARAWKGIVWHHSAGPDGIGRDWPSIVKYHTSYRVDYNTVTKEEFERLLKEKKGKSFQTPWKAVGYHGGIELVNGSMVFQYGRSFDMVGAHAGVVGASNAFNTEYLGLCALGNFDLTEPTLDMWKFALGVTKVFMTTFGIPRSHVIGHREVYDRLGVARQKSCPGTKWDMELFRNELV